MTGISRRDFIASGALAAGALTLSPAFLRQALAAPATAGAGPYGPLGSPDANGLQLPPGFSSRLLATGTQPVGQTGYVFPTRPDGQAVFGAADDGWVLVTNCEMPSAGGGGASAMRFAADGAVTDAYRILTGTNLNCAGGPTPWGTWLSCEEYDGGLVWECDPAGVHAAQPRPALGVFNHEAAAVDPVAKRLYLTEDEPDGCFYRVTPSAYPSLDAGLLEAALVAADGSVSWEPVPDPSATIGGATRDQVSGAATFDGGEGIWHHDGVLYFTTKGDGKVWAYTPAADTIEVLYDRAAAPGSSLDAVDNVTVNRAGEIFVCEDGGNMEIGLITPERIVSPFLRLPGAEHTGSETCGVCFDPTGSRMYLTSQRAFPLLPGQSETGRGAVYEVTGPFNGPPPTGPPPTGPPPTGPSPTGPSPTVAGPPAGEQRPQGPLNPGSAGRSPPLRLDVAARLSRSSLLRRGVQLTIELDRPAVVSLSLSTADLRARPGRGSVAPSAKTSRLALARARLMMAGRRRVRLRPSPIARRRLGRRRRPLDARVLVLARDANGRRLVATRSVRIG